MGGNGCYGTNPDHGFTFEEAKQEVIEFYKNRIKRIQELTEEDFEKGTFF
jgi:hypothetical protein